MHEGAAKAKAGKKQTFLGAVRFKQMEIPVVSGLVLLEWTAWKGRGGTRTGIAMPGRGSSSLWLLSELGTGTGSAAAGQSPAVFWLLHPFACLAKGSRAVFLSLQLLAGSTSGTPGSSHCPLVSCWVSCFFPSLY